jgi:hypothetical protein
MTSAKEKANDQASLELRREALDYAIRTTPPGEGIKHAAGIIERAETLLKYLRDGKEEPQA